MRAHDAAARRDAGVEHVLHDALLIRRFGEADAVALPVAAGPLWLVRQRQIGHRREEGSIVLGKPPSLFDDLRQPLELLAADGGLHIRHAVVETDRWVTFEDDLGGRVPLGIRDAHAVLAQKPELGVPFRVAGRQHPAFAGGDDFARMEREAGDIPVWLADAFPFAVDPDFAADGAGGVLNDRQRMTRGDLHDPRHVAGHANLVHTEDGLGALGDRRLDQCRIHVEGVGINVDEDGQGAAVTDAVGGRDEGMADGDDLVARPNPDGQECEVQGRGAARDCAGVGGADRCGE